MKGIIFDMDGTMFDTENISVKAIQHTIKKYGASMDMQTITRLFGLPSEEGRKIYLEKFGEDFDYAGFRKDKMEFQNFLIQKDGVPIKPGLMELLQYATEHDIRCAVATSTSRERTNDLLDRAGVIQFFSSVVCGEDVENGKPNPDIFLLAAKKMGVAPNECIVIEDSKHGIIAASRTGGVAVLVPDLVPVCDEMRQAADMIFESLFDVLTYIKNH